MNRMNVLRNIPFKDAGRGMRKVSEAPELLVMQMALRPEQFVPLHKANSNVRLLVLRGKIRVNLDGTDHFAEEGDLLPVAFATPMEIFNNDADADATFLVFKAPHPDQFPK